MEAGCRQSLRDHRAANRIAKAAWSTEPNVGLFLIWHHSGEFIEGEAVIMRPIHQMKGNYGLSRQMPDRSNERSLQRIGHIEQIDRIRPTRGELPQPTDERLYSTPTFENPAH
jgi:hypothetical protein